LCFTAGNRINVCRKKYDYGLPTRRLLIGKKTAAQKSVFQAYVCTAVKFGHATVIPPRKHPIPSELGS
jgi:hypothetical protein